MPRISVVFSLEELKEIEKDCAIYVGRMERVARHSSVSKEEQVRGPRRTGRGGGDSAVPGAAVPRAGALSSPLLGLAGLGTGPLHREVAP